MAKVGSLFVVKQKVYSDVKELADFFDKLIKNCLTRYILKKNEKFAEQNRAIDFTVNT